MATLIADRFLCDPGAVDLATGELVDLRIEQAGTLADQQAWSEACAKALGDRRARLVDFGFIGRDRRFEARSLTPRGPVSTSVAIDALAEWLGETRPASTKILYRAPAADDVLVLAREIRLRGFIPLSLSLLEGRHAHPDVSRAVAGRSVVLLEQHVAPPPLSLAFLTLLCAKARGVWAIVGSPAERDGRRPLVAQAAEARAAYGAPRGDVRAVRMLDEAHRLMAGGRHAAAERALRAALAAFDRRDDLPHAGEAAALLGRLLMNRGRAGDAESVFEIARERFRRLASLSAGPAGPAGSTIATQAAIEACVHMGLAQTDLGCLTKADETLRAAYSAAAALRHDRTHLAAAVALGRNMFWQGRYADATSVLESTTAEAAENRSEALVRYWCLAARIKLTTGDLPAAWGAAERAGEAVGEAGECEAIVRNTKAALQARFGDIEALEFHVRAGLRAAAVGHQPLLALRLRLTAIEGLLDAGHHPRARELGRRLHAMTKMPLPELLKRRLDRAVKGLAGTTARETAPAFAQAPHRQAALDATNLGDVDGLTELLSVCNDFEDEREALSRAAAVIRKQAGALGSGIVGSAGTDAVAFGVAGSVNQSLGRRCIDLGMPIGPERTAAGLEAATPIRYLGRVIGALVSRWSVEGPSNVERAMAFGAAAAAACAPVVYVLIERASSKSQDPEACPELIGTSQAIEDVRRAIARAANAPFTVLIEGESGSGKELVARAIHRTGCRRARRFCALNCAAMPEDLVDAELFGHAKGAFTGAATDRLGLFESADGGTVFLDEVGELSARAQAKLLRVLQEGEIRRIGETFTRPIDSRLIAATNRPLRAEVEAGRFRQDLLYRLDVIRIAVPPLRERVEDIPQLAARFWRQAAERIGSKAVLGQGAVSTLARYDWPGNVRELQNVLTALLVAVPLRGVVGASSLPAAVARAMTPAAAESLERARFRFEERFVRAALARAAGHRGQTATALGVSRQGLAKLLQRLQIP